MTGYIDANTFGNVNVYVHRNGNIITCIIVVGIVGICRGQIVCIIEFPPLPMIFRQHNRSLSPGYANSISESSFNHRLKFQSNKRSSTMPTRSNFR